MNNIYKVIWSKAKNCYVVASEIARSHTKSATGSEKIGGVTRRSLLASLMALSLLCGGLGVASAEVDVKVDVSSAPGAVDVYTKTGVDNLLADYGKKEDVQNNKNNITALQTKTTGQGEQIAINTTNIARNTADIEKKIDRETANATYATQDALNNLTTTVTGKADLTALEAKADRTYVDQKFTEAGTNVDNKLEDYYNKAVVDGKIAAEATARDTAINTAINTAIGLEREDRDAAIGNAITGEVAARNQAINTAIELEATKRDAAVANAKAELQGKITAEETARTAKDVELEREITQNSQAIETLDKSSVKYDNPVAKDTITLQGVGGTTITHLKDAVLSDSSTEAVTGKQLNQTNERTGGIKRETDGTKTTTRIEDTVTVDNSGNVGGVKGLSAETITTGNADIGTLTTTGQATFQEAVEMDKGLTVTGDTKLKATTVDGKLTAGDADLKNTQVNGKLGVTGETMLNDKLTAKGEATFEKNVTVEKDLTVNGKLNVGEIYMEHNKLESTGKQHNSATSITADGISNLAKVTEHGNTTESQFTHNEKGSFNYAKDKKITGEWKGATSNVTADGVSNKMTDSAGNTHTYYQTAAETKEQLVNGDKSKSNFEKKTAEGNTISITEKDADGNLKSSLTNTQTVNGEKTSVTNEDSSSTINQGADQIRYNVTSKDENKTSSSIEVKADGITNTSKDGTIINDAKDIVNKAQDTITNTAGTKITDTAGDSTVTTENGKGTTFTKTGSTAYREGGPTDTNISGNTITTGRVDANELGVSDKDGANTADLSVKAGEGVKASAGDGNTKGSLDVKADKVVSSVKDADGKGSTFKQRIDAIMGNVKTADGESEMKQKGDEITSVVGKGEATNSHVTQKKGSIEAAVTDGTSTNVSYDEASVSTKKMTDSDKNTHTYYQTATESKEQLVNGDKSKSNFEKKTAEGNTISITEKDAAGNPKSSLTNTQTVNGEKTSVTNNDSSSTIKQGADQIRYNVTSKDENKTSSSIEVKADGITNTSKDGTIINDAKDIVNKAQDTITNTAGTKITDTAGDSTVTTENGKGTTFTKTGSTAYREGGPTDTNISGNTITTGKVTMDYAKVMKDLGVNGNANIGGRTTTGSLEVTGTSTLKGNVTMESNATVGGTLEVTGKATFHNDVDITGDVTAKSYKVGGKTYIDVNGINANNQKITNVADGSISEGSKDAVNGGQLYNVKNDLEGKVNKVGANAAAMANLHPMEFDPDSKWNIAAAIGNYGSETAAALGAFYRPNDDVMVNLSTAFGTGENMVGGGVSVRLGKGGNKLSREESNALKDQVNDLTARMDALLSVLNPNMSKDFPDVPENHWAYEAVSRLAGNDIVQGYPDGEFHGERTMTRYEMAEIIYNALSRGAEAEKELVEEFKPELQAMAASEKATAERAEG